MPLVLKKATKFLIVFLILTVINAVVWEFVAGDLYDCTDGGIPGYFEPGYWVHSWPGNPVTIVPHVVHGRSMTEPDTIKAGWSVGSLLFLWCGFVAASFLASLSLARPRWIPLTESKRRTDQPASLDVCENDLVGEHGILYWCSLVVSGCRRAYRSAVMRAVIPLMCLLVTGCAALFSEGKTEIGVIPCQPATNVVLRTVLPRNVHGICFTSSRPVSAQGKVRVALSNNSNRSMSVWRPGAFADVPPHTSAELFDGTLSVLVEGTELRVSCWSGRARCELQIQFSPSPTLATPI